MKVWLSGIGISTAAVPDWESARKFILGESTYEESEYRYRPPEMLHGAERRRAPASVKLALDVAEQARAMAGIEGANLSAVFGSMTGDGPIVARSLVTLADDPHYLSPTDFHNSVHNAAVGYWAIATGSRHGSTSVTAAEESFPAALLKAAMQAACGETPVLLCVYEVPFPPPLEAQLPIPSPFGGALVLHGEKPDNSLACLEISLFDGGAAPDEPASRFWKRMFDLVPSARIIPLLERLAQLQPGEQDEVTVGAVGSIGLAVKISR
jgi:hypothetical protein